ncbi:ABC transporter ATP-binding protein [Kribbella pittospori]|uniref:ABC transporter ATP-binding protein n=1 Tax=Kribbella pittospori TaxID=722689 RepID=UPI00192E177F|nr:ABC transporter ATP-binding protein [Kribbella pittospori]
MTAALELDGVSRAFAGRPALEGFTLRVEPGEVVAIIGLNGAGKTTAMRILVGRLTADRGTARVLGTDPAHLPRAASLRFGHVVDTPLVYGELTVRENLRCAGRLHGFSAIGAARAAEQAMSRFELEPWADVRGRALSQGNRQRVGIAGAVLHRPMALVLDEPTSALDPRGVVIVRELVRELAVNSCAVLVSSHHLDEVARIADRIAVVHAGRVIGSLGPGETNLERRFFAMALADDESRAATGSVRDGRP